MTRFQRKVSWIEIFFDLVFVAAAHQLATVLIHSETIFESIAFLLLFLPILWVWVGHTSFTNRFDDSSKLYRFLTVAMMASVVGLVITLPRAFDDYFMGFALSYAFSRFILIALYMKVMFRNKALHPRLVKTVGFFSLSAVLWFISAFIPNSYIIWIIAFCIDFTIPIFANKELSSLSSNSTHLPERLGLLTVIMLGEMIISTTATTFQLQLSIDLVLLIIASIILIAVISWRYFLFNESCMQDESSQQYGLLFLYAHLPLYIGLVSLASGFKGVIAGVQTTWLIVLGILLFIASFLSISYIHEQRMSIKQLLLFILFLPILFIFPFFTQSLVFNIIVLCFVIVFYLILSEYMQRFFQKFFVRKPQKKKYAVSVSQKQRTKDIFGDS